MSRPKLSPIALDFGERTVKAVQLDRRGGSLQLREAQCVEIEPGPKDDESRRERLVQAASRALQRGKFRGRKAITAIRFADVTTRHIRVPAEHLDDYGQFLAAEIRDLPGGMPSELTFCALPVADLLESGKRTREYLCCVVDTRIIAEQMEVLEALRLTPVAIDLENCAQVRPFVGTAIQSSFLNVDLGYHSTRITIVKGGVPVLMRSVPLGSCELADTLVSKLDLDLDAIADLAQEDNSDSLQLTITRALAEQLNLVLERIADCVPGYCACLFQGRAVSPLRVVGSVSALPGLATYLGRRIGIKSEVGDPFAALAIPFAAGNRRANSGTFATALGLAMRGLTP